MKKPLLKKHPQQLAIENQDNILSLLLNAYYQIDSTLQQSLEKKGWQQFTHAQSMIFLNMAEGRLRIVDIARHMGLSKQAVHRTVNELVELGLIKLIPDPEDKRAKLLTLSSKGAIVTQDATLGLAKVEADIGRRLGSQQTILLKQLLKQLIKNPSAHQDSQHC
jgi:DNA-binding MarR family transcriptional regulator